MSPNAPDVAARAAARPGDAGPATGPIASSRTSRPGWASSASLPTDRIERDGVDGLGPRARRPAPVRHPGHGDPRPGPRADRLGPLRTADRRRVPQVVSDAPALERRVPVREVRAGRGWPADPEHRDPDCAASTATSSAWRSPARWRSATRCCDESASWLWIDGRIPDPAGRRPRNAALLDRYADRLPELLGS